MCNTKFGINSLTKKVLFSCHTLTQGIDLRRSPLKPAQQDKVTKLSTTESLKCIWSNVFVVVAYLDKKKQVVKTFSFCQDIFSLSGQFYSVKTVSDSQESFRLSRHLLTVAYKTVKTVVDCSDNCSHSVMIYECQRVLTINRAKFSPTEFVWILCE